MIKKICTKCKQEKDLEGSFYKIHKGKHYLSECKECFKERTENDRKKRGLEHDREVKKVWTNKHGGKEYNRQAAHRFYWNNLELVRKNQLTRYHKNKKICRVCNRIRSEYKLVKDSNICKECQSAKIMMTQIVY